MIAEHPLPWLAPLLNGVEHANFFDPRATEYSKAATRGVPHRAVAEGAENQAVLVPDPGQMAGQTEFGGGAGLGRLVGHEFDAGQQPLGSNVAHQRVARQGCELAPEIGAHLLTVGEERSEEHTSELQSLMRTSYAVFCL